MQLIPANQFSAEQLTEAYNQTRIDYLVPMPMNVARLREYVHLYNVDLSASCVAVDGEEMLGIGMLGVREGRAWITRLGVLPNGRRRGVGRAIMDFLISAAEARQVQAIWLEVIKGNDPAYHLFCSYGFTITRELLVARRPPSPNAPFITQNNLQESIQRINLLDQEESLILLSHRRERPNWLIETESMQNIPNLAALLVELKNGGRGWVSYHASVFQLARIVVEITAGDPAEVTAAVLQALHQRHASHDAVMENMPVCHPTWPGFEQAGYFEAFRRIEMVKPIAKP